MANEADKIENVLKDMFEFTVKPKQIEAIKSIYNGKDTLCIFPTAFGKSLIFQCLPKLVSTMDENQEKPVVIVVSPLLSLIEDQVLSANNQISLSITACNIKDIDSNAVLSGRYNLLFGTPESWMSPKWREMLSTTFMIDNLYCIVVDEVHKVTWGQSSGSEKPFRETFSRIGEMRSLCRQNVPVLALSATIDINLTELVISSCCLSKSLKVISTCSDRPNLFLEVKKVEKQENIECLQWLVKLIEEYGIEECPKTIIFCRSVVQAGLIYWQLNRLVTKLNVNSKEIVGIYHSETLEKNKEKVLKSLTDETSSSMRIVVATSSLGCGVNMKKLRYVIHFGPAYHLVDYCQQVGRAGRDGNNLCNAILYHFPQGNSNISRSMRNYINKSKEQCLRSMLFSPFNENNNIVKPKLPGHECCSFCAASCHCETCVNKIVETPEPINDDENNKIELRPVSNDDENLVRELLLDYHEKVSCTVPLLVPPQMVTGVTDGLIENVIKHLPFIDSMEYVTNNLNVPGKSLAKHIARIVKEVFIDENGEDLFIGLSDDDSEDEKFDSDTEACIQHFSDFSISDFDDGFSSLEDSDY